MESLPVEITGDICSRLPCKLSCRCKCVSKQWKSIISDTKFPISQFTKHTRLTPPDILLYYYDPNSLKPGTFFYVEDNDEALEAFPNNPIKPFDRFFIPSNPNRVLGSCNGFVCLSSDDSGLPSNPIYIVNPITRKYSTLPPYEIPSAGAIQGDIYFPSFSLSGFAHNQRTNKFKLVLLLFTLIDSQDINEDQSFENQVQVCTLGSNTWAKKIGVVPDMLRQVTARLSSAYVNDSLHWFVIDGILSNYRFLLHSFHTESETFDMVPSPCSTLLRLGLGNDDYSLGVIEDKLSIVKSFIHGGCIEIYVMENYGVKESWVKRFSILQDLFSGPNMFHVKFVKYRTNAELVLLFEAKTLISYNTQTHKYKSVQAEGSDGYLLHACPFVGRFISFESAFGMPSMESTSHGYNIL